MNSHRLFALTILVAMSAFPGFARGADSAAASENSTQTGGLMLEAGTPWKDWLQANYPRKVELDERAKKSLDRSAGGKWDDRFIGDILKDGEPVALLAKFSPTGKTVTRFMILRQTKGSWTPLIDCSRKKVVYGKHAPITSNEPVDVYQVYLERGTAGLDLMITLGSAGDKLFGDAVSLSYDVRTRAYVEPDDTDHD